jgi:two-component system, cell cycle response regulator DivK
MSRAQKLLDASRATRKRALSPVIAVTAFAMSGDEAKILASGCDAYVSKPFNVAEFLNLIEQWSRSR